MDKIAVIDIGTTKIIVLIAKKTENGKIEIIGYSEQQSQGIENGTIKNIPQAIVSIRKAVEQAKNLAKTEISEVYVGIAGHSIKTDTISHSIILEGQTVRKKDIDKLIEEAYKTSVSDDEQVIHVIPQEFIIDDKEYIENPLMMPGKKLGANLLLIRGNQTAAKIIDNVLKQVNLKPKKYFLEPLAAAEAVLEQDELSAGVALIDIGGGTTDLIIFKNNKVINTAIIPFGGQNVTRDIAAGLQIPPSIAENIKQQYAYAISPVPPKKNKQIEIPGIAGRDKKITDVHKISKIAFARMLEIVDTVKSQIEKWELKDHINAGITLTGGGALLKYTEKLFQFRTDIETRLATPKLDKFNEEYQFLNNPRYSTAVGLLLLAFKEKEKEKKEKNQTDKQHYINKENNQQEIENYTENIPKKTSLFKKIIKNIKDFFITEDTDDSDIN